MGRGEAGNKLYFSFIFYRVFNRILCRKSDKLQDSSSFTTRHRRRRHHQSLVFLRPSGGTAVCSVCERVCVYLIIGWRRYVGKLTPFSLYIIHVSEGLFAYTRSSITPTQPYPNTSLPGLPDLRLAGDTSHWYRILQRNTRTTVRKRIKYKIRKKNTLK